MKQLLKIIATGLVLLLVGQLAAAQNTVQRGSPVPAQCGNIIEGSFSANFEEHPYKVEMRSGEILDVSVVPFGNQLTTGIFITGPTNIGIIYSDGRGDSNNVHWINVELEPKANTGALSASGEYTIRLVNFSQGLSSVYTFAEDAYKRGGHASGGVGDYLLYIGCTLRDGTVINPGDVLPVPEPTSPAPPSPAGSELAPTSLPGAASIPLTSGSPFTSTISAEGIPPYTFTLSALSGDTLALQVDRTSGNLNLGVVVLSPASEVLFYGGLIASNTVSASLTLPTDGQYIIGVFRVDLVPPATPEATTFQVLGTVNP
jgi:hypothetical protein